MTGNLMDTMPLDDHESLLLKFAASVRDEKHALTVASDAIDRGVRPLELLHVAVALGDEEASQTRQVLDAHLGSNAWQRSIASMSVSTPQFSTSVVDTGGSGTPLVLIHAIGLNRFMWSDVIAQLPTSDRVLAYDLRGHTADGAVVAPFTMADNAADLAALLDNLEVEKVRLCGLSYGGAVAQEFALRYPERVEQLFLMCTTVQGFPAFLDRAADAEEKGLLNQLGTTLTRWFEAETLAEAPWAVRYARARLQNMNSTNWAHSWRAFAEIANLDDLSELQLDIHVVAGSDDQSTPPSLMQTIADGLPGSHFHTVDGPHMLSLLAPDKLADILRAP